MKFRSRQGAAWCCVSGFGRLDVCTSYVRIYRGWGPSKLRHWAACTMQRTTCSIPSYWGSAREGARWSVLFGEPHASLVADWQTLLTARGQSQPPTIAMPVRLARTYTQAHASGLSWHITQHLLYAPCLIRSIDAACWASTETMRRYKWSGCAVSWAALQKPVQTQVQTQTLRYGKLCAMSATECRVLATCHGADLGRGRFVPVLRRVSIATLLSSIWTSEATHWRWCASDPVGCSQAQRHIAQEPQLRCCCGGLLSQSTHAHRTPSGMR